MATNYASDASANQTAIIRAGIAMLCNVLAPYRNDPVVTRKLFGVFTLTITIGDILDFLSRTFGITSST